MNLDEYTANDLILKGKSLRRQLSATEGLHPVRIAILGGSTTNEVVDLLELFLLASGFRPVFHQSEYGRFYEDAVLDPERSDRIRTRYRLHSHLLYERAGDAPHPLFRGRLARAMWKRNRAATSRFGSPSSRTSPLKSSRTTSNSRRSRFWATWTLSPAAALPASSSS